MIRLRKAAERGQADHGWLKSAHTFSFAEYHDPAFMGYSVLRVINDDVIAPGTGFGMHPHRNMEIVTYVLEGVLRHQDSMGNGAEIRAGEVQRMSAGSGIRHSEFNASESVPVHLLQIWIVPERNNLVPGYEQMAIPADEKRAGWRPIATPDGCAGSLTIHQHAMLLATMLGEGAQAQYHPADDRRLYLHLARGTVLLNGAAMEAGDGAFIEQENMVTLSNAQDAEALLFDLP